MAKSVQKQKGARLISVFIALGIVYNFALFMTLIALKLLVPTNFKTVPPGLSRLKELFYHDIIKNNNGIYSLKFLAQYTI